MTIEPPERKVLKEIIMKLKAKTIESQKNYVGLSLSMTLLFANNLKQLWETITKMPVGEAKDMALMIFSVFQMVNQNLLMLNTTTISLIGDMNLYIETLERYSTELDNTFAKIIEMAKEEAKKKEDEQRKQLEELKKRVPSYTT